jgi:thiol:disulfide interchange protein DsbA
MVQKMFIVNENKLRVGLFLCALFLLNNVNASEKYIELPFRAYTNTGEKIEVLEFFWYGCSHCYEFESAIEEWLEDKAEYIEFVRMPAVLGASWMLYARGYYVAKHLGVFDKIHRPLFDAIHKEKRSFTDKKSLKKYFEEQGVSGDEFDTTYDSKDVQDSVRYAYSMGQRYGVKGVPAVIINGKYATSATMAGSYKNMIDVIKKLAEKENVAKLK